jgi:hypothetical protein
VVDREPNDRLQLRLLIVFFPVPCTVLGLLRMVFLGMPGTLKLSRDLLIVRLTLLANHARPGVLALAAAQLPRRSKLLNP